ncbi:MAG: ribose 5-phosphate isomerase B [Gemmatimonadales bacterium]
MRSKHAITEADVRAAARSGRTLALPKGAIVTPAARDLARQLGVALVTGGQADGRTGGQNRLSESADRPPDRPSASLPVVALGADHGGFPMKEGLKSVLDALGYAVLDLGTDSTDSVDYPDYAVAVARAVADQRAWRGIMVDGAGIGSSMAANKVPGVRAALCYDLTTAANAREHNDANVLTLGGTLIGARLAAEIVKTFLTTAFGGGRHAPRVEKINRLDRR